MSTLLIAYLTFSFIAFLLYLVRSALTFLPGIFFPLLMLAGFPFFLLYSVAFNFSKVNKPGLIFFLLCLTVCLAISITGYKPF